MKFYPPTNEPLSIGLTSGHMAVVTAEGTPLESMFHKEAVARGAIPETLRKARKGGGDDGDAALAAAAEQRGAAIREAITGMLNGDDEGDFNADGTPNLGKLKTKVGFAVTREEAVAIFNELTKQE